MCAVSFVGDHFSDKFRREYPNYDWVQLPYVPPQVTKEEFDELKAKVDEMMELLKRAKEYDIKTGQPDCEMEEKISLLRKVAELVGVDINEVLNAK